MDIIVKFVLLLFFTTGVIAFVLHRVLISSTEGAVKRLNDEIGKATAKQAELSRKLREADEELSKRQTEARQLAEKMRTDAENESRVEREKIIKRAREEGEEIIAKAQHAKERMKIDLEKDMDNRGIDFGMQILNKVLSNKAKGSLDEILIHEFLESLKNIDMSRISSDVKEIEIISLSQPTDDLKKQVVQIVKTKLNREVGVAPKVDAAIGGGIILKFGSMALDGSVRNLMRDVVTSMKKDVEARAS